MTKEKEDLLNKCHADFLEICFGDFPMDLVHTKVSDKITGYGTIFNENIQSFKDLSAALKMQREEAGWMNMNFSSHPISGAIISQNEAAVFVDELKLIKGMDDSNSESKMLLTSVFEYTEDGWRAVYFHSSQAQGSEEPRDKPAENSGKKENAALEKMIADKTEELRQSHEHLKATREKLILQEKLAGLGQLAAGIAHEIKNPLNFVNNFSEVSVELIDEALSELATVKTRHAASQAQLSSPDNESLEETIAILNDVKSNLIKVHQHGTRADSIVKSMLMHSRGGSGISEPTDLNELIREYVNLSFHGMRAGKKAINVKIDLDLEENLPPVSLYPEDFSRVVLNLCKNAFDAMREKGLNHESSDYKAVLKVQTKKQGNHAALIIEDNGPGVPDAVRNKLFEPFFTTKKAAEGTGLGLSITRDIIKSHNGDIHLESSDSEFTRFTITLPF